MVVKYNSCTQNFLQAQKINATSKSSATHDLQDLVDKILLKQTGTRGRGIKYGLYA
jgi:predicted HTH transcriptional regulator